MMLLIRHLEDQTRALMEMRQALLLSLTESLELSKSYPNCIARGTQAEMKWLQYRLEQKKVASRIVESS